MLKSLEHLWLYNTYSSSTNPVINSDDILVNSPDWHYYPIILNNKFSSKFPNNLKLHYNSLYNNGLPFAASYVLFKSNFKTQLHVDTEFTASFCKRTITSLYKKECLDANQVCLIVDNIVYDFSTITSVTFDASKLHLFYNTTAFDLPFYIEDFKYKDIPEDWYKNEELFMNHFTYGTDWPIDNINTC